MKEKLKGKKGITLIALVITIIVMLILVAVTINMAINGGLFGYAANAARDTKTARDEEQRLGAIPNNLTTNELIERFTTVPNIHTWTREGDTFTCSHCNASYTMGEVVRYTPNASKTSTTVSGADSGVEDGINDNKLTASDFGTNGEQTITRENGLIWIVLGLDKDGALLITIQNPTTATLTLYGKKAYINGQDIMNKVCEELYSNNTYGKARSISIDDVNLALEWTDKRGEVADTLAKKYKVSAGTKFGDVGTDQMAQEDWDEIKNNNQTPETGKELTDYEIDGYSYFATDVANINNIRQQAVFGTAEKGKSWMDVQSVSANAADKKAYFGLGYISKSRYACKVQTFWPVFYSNGTDLKSTLGLRPVVPLKSELPPKVNS